MEPNPPPPPRPWILDDSFAFLLGMMGIGFVAGITARILLWFDRTASRLIEGEKAGWPLVRSIEDAIMHWPLLNWAMAGGLLGILILAMTLARTIYDRRSPPLP